MAVRPPASTANGTPAISGDYSTGLSLEQMRAQQNQVRPPRRSAGVVWFGVCVATVVLVALVVFILQNTQEVLVSFLDWQGSVPLALALLIAGTAVGIVALVLGTIRVAQLRRRLARTGR